MPLIEIAKYADISGIGRPYGKMDSVNAIHGHHMGAEFFIYLMMITHAEKIQILLPNLRQKKVRIMNVTFMAVFSDTLYVGIWNQITGVEVWRSANGTTWFHWPRAAPHKK